MPELPEVETIVTTLRPHVTGSLVRDVFLARADIVTPYGCNVCGRLVGQTILGVSRRGKRIIFMLERGEKFYVHLGMSGRLGVFDPADPAAPHTHLRLTLSHVGFAVRTRGKSTVRTANPTEVIELRFCDPRRFGGIFWPTDCEAGLGPEPLTITPRQLADRLAKTRRPIKSALLDQRLIAGLGNIYVDESLFAAGIHPLTRSDRLTGPQVVKLTAAIKRILNRAIHHRGSTLRDYRDADGNSGGFQKIHKVYAREGQPCLKCGIPLKRIVITGRSTHFCPKCQKRRQSGAAAPRTSP